MNQKNSFIDLGQTRAAIGIKEKAKQEIAAVASSLTPAEAKTLMIKRIEEKRDDEIRKSKNPHILWSNR